MSNLPGGRTNLAQERANRAKNAVPGVTFGGAAFLNVGQVTGTVAAGDDPRLSIGGNLPAGATLVNSSDVRLTNARTPTAHAATHGATGTDPIPPLSINAVVAPAGGGILCVDSGVMLFCVETSVPTQVLKAAGG